MVNKILFFLSLLCGCSCLSAEPIVFNINRSDSAPFEDIVINDFFSNDDCSSYGAVSIFGLEYVLKIDISEKVDLSSNRYSFILNQLYDHVSSLRDRSYWGRYVQIIRNDSFLIVRFRFEYLDMVIVKDVAFDAIRSDGEVSVTVITKPIPIEQKNYEALEYIDFTNIPREKAFCISHILPYMLYDYMLEGAVTIESSLMNDIDIEKYFIEKNNITSKETLISKLNSLKKNVSWGNVIHVFEEDDVVYIKICIFFDSSFTSLEAWFQCNETDIQFSLGTLQIGDR